MTLTLTLREPPSLPLDAAALRPDGLSGLRRAEIGALALRHGARPARVRDFFDVDGDGEDDVVVAGDLRRVTHLGTSMSAGRLTIAGPAGMHVGARMSGGLCVAQDDVGAWAGAELRGGRLIVRGNAGDRLAAAYPGARTGMTAGEVLVHGDAGDEVGAGLRRGLVAVGGAAGDGVGLEMLAGTVIALGGIGRHCGLGLRRGSIVAPAPVEMLPGYAFACRFRPPALRLALVHLDRLGLPLGGVPVDVRCARWSGDQLALTRGEILIMETGR